MTGKMKNFIMGPAKGTVVDAIMKKNQLTSVQQFYNGKNVMITGATGFLGKILTEKLLRSCPGVEKLYLLVRQKKGKNIYERLEETFKDPVFDRLKEQQPKFRHKVVAVPADCEAAGLGLALDDQQMLIENVNIIFHGAATVRFDEHLRKALNINVNGALNLLRLVKNMKNLDVLMHISTAYSNSHLSCIKERFYPCDADYQKLLQMIDKLSDKEIDDLQSKILGSYPNTYTFTKALAEKELRANTSGLPVAIFRPAIVISTYKEPISSWVDNTYGPAGLLMGYALGIFRVLKCNPDNTAELVPVDSVVNGLIVAAAKVNATYKTSTPPPEPPIFNYVSSPENRITWGDFIRKVGVNIDQYPFLNAVWYKSLTLRKFVMLYQIDAFYLRFVIGAYIYALIICLGGNIKLLKVYKGVQNMSAAVSYFVTHEIKFSNKNTQELWNSTTDGDKQLFPFSMKECRWDEYLDGYILGVRRYLCKESDDTLPQARKRWRRLYYLHQSMKTIIFIPVIYTLWYSLH